MLLNSIIAHLFGPWEGRWANQHLLKESGLLGKCEQYALCPGADGNTPLQDRHFQIFGNLAYGNTHVMESLFAGAGQRTPEEDAWNAQMLAVRIKVEHGFSVVLKL
jgi:hypothetical protein